MSVSSFVNVEYSPGGVTKRVTLHATAGHGRGVVLPSWADTCLIRIYTSSTTPPTAPTAVDGWYFGDASKDDAAIGTDSLFIPEGEGLIIERSRKTGEISFSLAANGVSAVAEILFSARNPS